MAAVKWWGYMNNSGDIVLKRYIDKKSVKNSLRPISVLFHIKPFYAFTHKEATKKLQEILIAKMSKK